MNGAAGDAQPLAGRRVLVTRPRSQAERLVQELETAGAEVILAPTIQIVAPDDRGPLLEAISQLPQFDWIIFASVNAVDAFMDAGVEAGSTHNLPLVAAVGARTAERLQGFGVEVSLVPTEFRAEAVVEAMKARGPLDGVRVLLPRSDIGRDTIADGLRAAGAIVTDVVAYRTVAESTDRATDVRGMLQAQRLDAITFTSGSAVRSFIQMYGPDIHRLLGDTVVAVVGPVTAAAARELGFAVHVQPETYTTGAMVDALARYFSSPRPPTSY